MERKSSSTARLINSVFRCFIFFWNVNSMDDLWIKEERKSLENRTLISLCFLSMLTIDFPAHAIRTNCTDRSLSLTGQFAIRSCLFETTTSDKTSPNHSNIRTEWRGYTCQETSTNIFLCFIGKKVCLHLHGVFPYLLVKSPTDELRYGEQLAQSLDMAINLAFEKGDTETKHVYNISLLDLMYWEIVWRLNKGILSSM